MEISRINGSQLTGVCKFWNAVKGFGFITCDDGGADLFISQHDIVTGDAGFRALTAGQRVECSFTVDAGKAMGKKVTGPNGANCPSFKDMYCAKRTIEGAKPADPNKTFGTIKWFNVVKNIGFIVPTAGGEDIFFHFTECLKGIVPTEDDQVEYVLKTDRNGKPMAGSVKNKTQRTPRPNQPVQQVGGMQQPMGGMQQQQAQVQQGNYAMQNQYGKRSGLCKFFNEAKGYGFIIPDHGGRDIMVHKSQIMGGELVEGDAVEYEEQMGRGNKVQATSVSKKAAPAMGIGNLAPVNPRFY